MSATVVGTTSAARYTTSTDSTVPSALPHGAATRLRRWVGRIRAPQAVEGRGSAAA